MKISSSIFSNSKVLKTATTLCFLILFTGCLSLKPGAIKSGANLFETFYVGEDGTQYFIKPLSFINSQNENTINTDFTFRYKDEVKDSAIINLSVRGSDIFKKIDSLSISNTTSKITSNNVNLLFNEKRNKLFNSRFSTKIPLIELNELFKDEDWGITLYSNGTSTTYSPNKKTKKHIKKLKDKVFILFL